ncbi:glyoxal oxidase [Moniliophthora roreri]|nr:glyoxal oxidase [Moniliophthora roreri]
MATAPDAGYTRVTLSGMSGRPEVFPMNCMSRPSRPEGGKNSKLGSVPPPDLIGSSFGVFRLIYPPLVNPPIKTMLPSPSGPAAAYHRSIYMKRAGGLSDH